MKIEVHGEIHILDGPKALLNLIEQKMGIDTRGALEDFIQEGLDLYEDYEPGKMKKHFEAAL